MFNLAVMYQYGDGVVRDLHLAKRFLDSALEVAPESLLPVTLAMAMLEVALWVESAGWPTHPRAIMITQAVYQHLATGLLVARDLIDVC